MELREFDPTAIFGTLRRMVEGVPVDEEDEIPASIQYFGEGKLELVKALRRPALDLLHALAEMVIACAKPAWGEPRYYVRHSTDHVPDWFEPYQYSNGVPRSIHCLVGWERGEKLPLVWIAEEDFGSTPGLCVSLILLVFE